MNANNIIPKQNDGMETNTESSTELTSEHEARQFFREVKRRLLDVNHWHQYAGNMSADFQLTDGKGNPVSREPVKGDHFKINIPGPSGKSGEGNDWVQVEAIDEDPRSLGIRVRPATNPTNQREDVAHFFSEGTTSTFMAKLEGNTVTAGVYGRNEKPNTQAETFADKLRNAAVATGAMSGFSKLQWKSLVNGLVNKN